MQVTSHTSTGPSKNYSNRMSIDPVPSNLPPKVLDGILHALMYPLLLEMKHFIDNCTLKFSSMEECEATVG